MQIKILHLIEGAKQAEGLTVIIDVFRAFSLECYLYDMGVKEIRPVGTIEEAFQLKNKFKNSVLVGERHGRNVRGLIMEIRHLLKTYEIVCTFYHDYQMVTLA